MKLQIRLPESLMDFKSLCDEAIHYFDASKEVDLTPLKNERKIVTRIYLSEEAIKDLDFLCKFWDLPKNKIIVSGLYTLKTQTKIRP